MDAVVDVGKYKEEINIIVGKRRRCKIDYACWMTIMFGGLSAADRAKIDDCKISYVTMRFAGSIWSILTSKSRWSHGQALNHR